MFERLLAALTLTAATALLAAADEPPLRDPMRPFEPVQPSGPGRAAPERLTLSAVLISPQRRVAVINGAIHREGDWIDGAQITRIEPRLVHMRRGGEEIVVRLQARGRAASQDDQGDPAS